MTTASDSLPERNEEYASRAYWDQRYAQEAETTFDWFKSYRDVAHLLRAALPDKTARILMLGCGNSTLSEDMYNDGYKNIVNVDYSPVVIKNMSERNHSRPEMQWLVMDVRDLTTFGDDTFDVAIDKGTMDAMMTAKGDVWDPPQKVIEDCTKEVDEILQVLRKGSGKFLYLTFGQPHFRRRYLMRPDTKLEIQQIGDAFHYFLYILRSEQSA